MKTEKIQRLDDNKDLKAINAKDIIEAESFGLIVCYDYNKDKLTFVRRGRGGLLENITINPNLNHVVKNGKVNFRDVHYTQININNPDYNSQNKLLEEMEM